MGCRVVTMAVALAIRPLKLGEPGALVTAALRTGMTGACVGWADTWAAPADVFLCPPCCVAAGAWLPADLPCRATASLRWFFAALGRAAVALPRTGVAAGLRAAALAAPTLPGLWTAAALAAAGARLLILATVVGLVTVDVFFTPEAFFAPDVVPGLADATFRAALAGLPADLRTGLATRTGEAFAAVFFTTALTAGLVARVAVGFFTGLPPLAVDAAADLARAAVLPDPLDFPFVCTLSGLKRPLFFAISSSPCIGRGGRVL